MRRLALASFLVAGVVATATGAAAVECPAANPGEVGVLVVVDYGDLSDAPDPSVACVSVAEGSDGNEVLAARADQLGVPPPRYDPSGLLCAIDGRPESGCGDRTETGFRYWSYWLGDDRGWEYASVGPGFREISADVTEGWRFVDGTGRPTDPPPALPPDAATTIDARPASTSDGGGDAVVGALIGAAGVGGLVVGGFLVTRRRRRADG